MKQLIIALILLMLIPTITNASTFSTHLSAGTIIGNNIDDPTTAFVLGLISHPILDNCDKEYYIADVWEGQDLIGAEIILSGVQIYRVWHEPDANKRKTLKWALLGATLFDLIDTIQYLKNDDLICPWHYDNGAKINSKNETIKNATIIFVISFAF